LLLTLLLLGAAFVREPKTSAISLASMLAGIPIYYLSGAHRRVRPT
jgi:hypothetical protein